MSRAFCTLEATGCHKKVPSWLMKGGLLVLAIIGFVAAYTAQAWAATVTTDKPDYAAADLALIGGSSWEPGEIVALEISQVPPLHPADTLYTIAEVIADEAGNIYSGYIVPGHDV